MSNEPFRMSGAPNRDAEPESQPEERPAASSNSRYESKPAHRSSRRHSDKEPKSPVLKYVVAAVGAGVIIAVVAWLVMTALGAKMTGIDSGKYQAVFFTNGQVYFGKLQSGGSGYLRLTDVYYLQTQAAAEDSTNPQDAATDQGNATLIKLGDEIHGPEDEMIISEEQVLFYENLKKDGKVSQSIEKHKSENK